MDAGLPYTAHAGAACRQGASNGQLPNSYSQLNAQGIWVFGSILYFTSGSHTAFYPDKYALVIGVIISTVDNAVRKNLEVRVKW
jgi:hypothetical protein